MNVTNSSYTRCTHSENIRACASGLPVDFFFSLQGPPLCVGEAFAQALDLTPPEEEHGKGPKVAGPSAEEPAAVTPSPSSQKPKPDYQVRPRRLSLGEDVAVVEGGTLLQAESGYLLFPATFGDIWCMFVSFGPAPHIYQRGERVGEPVCTIHGHDPESVRQGSMVPGTGPTLSAYT